MNYCSSCDIAYEEKNCPLCVAKDEIQELKTEIIRRDNEEDK